MCYVSILKRFLQFVEKMFMIKFESLNQFLVCIFKSSIIFLTSGPFLPMPLVHHSMVRLGKGQAILGGRRNMNHHYESKIYVMNCSNRNCTISLLNRELQVARENFVAIPIPDKLSGCTTEGNINFQNRGTFYIIFIKYIPLHKTYQIPLLTRDGYCYDCNYHCSFDTYLTDRLGGKEAWRPPHFS